MNEPASLPSAPDKTAHGFANLGTFLRRYGAMIALVSSPLQLAGGYWLKTTFQTKAEARTQAGEQDKKIEENKQLVYDRTRPMNERITVLESQYKTIEAKLDGANQIAAERAKHQDQNDANTQRSLQQIQDLLMHPPAVR